MVRKLFVTLIVSVLLLGVFVPAVLAGPEVEAEFIPYEVLPGDMEWAAAFGMTAFDDLYVDVASLPWDSVYELPQTSPQDDDLYHAFRPLNLCFDFHFMQGPAQGLPVYRLIDASPYRELLGYTYELADAGYDSIWVSPRGMTLFPFSKDVTGNWIVPPTGSWAAPWIPQDFGPGYPNNLIAPFWNNTVINDNNYQESTADGARTWWVERPRGRMLTTCLGEEPNRVQVIEWVNARDEYTGFLSTFEMQLFEGSNAILFLYKDFEAKSADVWHSGTPIVIGMEGFFGHAIVGQMYLNDSPLYVSTSGGTGWDPYTALPVAAQSMRGFVYP